LARSTNPHWISFIIKTLVKAFSLCIAEPI
jgi:hypothetical protein